MRKRADQPSYEQQEAIIRAQQSWANIADPAAQMPALNTQGMPSTVTFTSSSTTPATYYTASQLMQNK